jgi:protein TonB
MRRDTAIYAAALVASLLGHLLLFEGLGQAARRAERAEPRIIELAVIERQPPPPPPEPEKPRIEPPKPIDLTREVKPPPEAPPPPNTQEPPEARREPPRPVFGVSMSSVVGPGSGSSFSVRVGNTLMKEPEAPYTPPAQVKPYGPVPLYEVTKMPRKLGDCDIAPEAKNQGIEGKVRLEIEVLEDGRVGNVKLVVGLSPRIDALVIEAMKKCHFAPAEKDGRAVTVTLFYTWSFYAED